MGYVLFSVCDLCFAERSVCTQETLVVCMLVWYGMVNVDLYCAIITKVSNALNTLVSGEQPGFQALSKGLIVLLCAEVVPARSSRPWGCAQRMC